MSFQPTQISGCVLWLDAMDPANFTLSGSVITSWIDKSGRGFNATPFNSPTFANSAANLAGTAYFSGTTSIASGALLTTSFCVATTPSSFNAGTNRLLSVTSGSTNDFNSPTGFVYSAINPTGTSYAFRSVNCQTVTAIPVNTRFMTTTIYNAGGTFNHSINGNFPDGIANSFASATNVSNTNALITYYLGVAWNGSVNTGQSWKGLVHEILIFNRTLTQAEYQQVEGYLAWKWGLQNSLPTTHSYYAFSPLSFIVNQTQITLVNTVFNRGLVLLPSSFTIPGRNLIFKDSTGAFSTNFLTLTVNNRNQRIDSAFTSTINSSRLGWTNLMAGDNNNWFTIGGTTINTINTSTMNAGAMNTRLISTGTIFLSTLGLVDQSWANSTNSISVQSTFMYYQSQDRNTIISGTRQSFGGTFLRTSPLFQPNQLSGLQLWMDGADQNTLVLSGNRVNRWIDKANGIQLGQTGGLTPPTYSNDVKGVYFTNATNGNYVAGVTQGLAVSNPPISINFTAHSHYVVVQPLGGTSGYAQVLRIQSAAGATFGFFANNVNAFPTENVADNYALYTNATASYLTTRHFRTVNIGTNGMFIFLNGVLGGASNYNYTSVNTVPLTTLSMGGFTDNRSYSGFIFESIYYNRVLSTAEQQQVEAYLAWKWNLVPLLPGNNPYRNSPP